MKENQWADDGNQYSSQDQGKAISLAYLRCAPGWVGVMKIFHLLVDYAVNNGVERDPGYSKKADVGPA